MEGWRVDILSYRLVKEAALAQLDWLGDNALPSEVEFLERVIGDKVHLEGPDLKKFRRMLR